MAIALSERSDAGLQQMPLSLHDHPHSALPKRQHENAGAGPAFWLAIAE
jgi:hypothetical protein